MACSDCHNPMARYAESGLLRTDAAPLATVISWEVFFGHRARSGVQAGGQLLYNPTNGATYTFRVMVPDGTTAGRME